MLVELILKVLFAVTLYYIFIKLSTIFYVGFTTDSVSLADFSSPRTIKKARVKSSFFYDSS